MAFILWIISITSTISLLSTLTARNNIERTMGTFFIQMRNGVISERVLLMEDHGGSST